MKLLTLALIIFSSSFFMVPSQANSLNLDKEDIRNSNVFCSVLGDLGATFMVNRNKGVTIEEARKDYMRAKPDQQTIEIVESVLESAYSDVYSIEHLTDERDKEMMSLVFGMTIQNSCIHVIEERKSRLLL